MEDKEAGGEDFLSKFINKFITKQLIVIFFFTVLIIALGVLLNILNYRWRKHTYEFKLSSSTLKMKDGVSLSVTFAIPEQRRLRERFPVVLDYSPYRKEDTTYIQDYKYFTAFASSGYIVARVDVRGTGSSDGQTPERLFSDQELDDGVQVIAQLAALPQANGKVAIYGIAYNALMLAAKKPPALAAIYTLHATEDVYYNNNNNLIDGVMHKDDYLLTMIHENSLPRSPKYTLNEEYYTNRFNRMPWLMTYMGQQVDGDFWRKQSIKYDYDSISVPIYMVAGLYDGYRDFALNVYESLKGKVPMKVAIGPHNHEFPSYSVPGPNYDGKEEALRWFNRWTKGMNNDITHTPDVSLFIRDSYLPDSKIETIPGTWRYDQWPNSSTRQKLFFTDGHGLSLSMGAAAHNHTLEYNPASGHEAGHWWGDRTGNMATLDMQSLVYDSDVLVNTTEIVGFTSVSLKGSASAALAHWVVRLEELFPDGKSTLVTGAILNGAHRNGVSNPQYLVANETYIFTLRLHFTTWRFQPGNRIRVSVSNAQFPMIWPSPHAMTTKLVVNDKDTWIELPVADPIARPQVPAFTLVEPQEFYPFITKTLQRQDAFNYEEISANPRNHRVCATNTTTQNIWTVDTYANIRGMLVANFKTQVFSASVANPAQSAWVGFARTLYVQNFGKSTSVVPAPNPLVGQCDISGLDPAWMPQGVDFKQKKTVDVRTNVQITSDVSNFYCTVKKSVFENGALVKEATFSRTYPRLFQ